MKKRDFNGKIRLSIVILMSLVASFSLMSGIGTTCVAFAPAKWGDAFVALIPYASIYQVITVITIIVGFAASIITYAFVRGDKWAYIAAIITILVGLISGAVHVYYSSTLRGSATPANLRVIIDVVALLFLLIIRLPSIWNKIDLTKPMGNKRSFNFPTGAACMVTGLGLLSTPLYAGPSHTFDGINYVEYLLPELYIVGGIFCFMGISLIIMAKFNLDIEHGFVQIWNKTFQKKA